MALFGLIKGVGKQKLRDASEELSRAIVSWDPEAASEAQLEEMDEKFRQLSLKVEKARQDYQKENTEAVEIQKSYDRKKKAALLLQEDLTKLEGDAKLQTESALVELVSELEELKPEVEQEQREAEEAKQWLEELEGDLRIFADKLKTARKKLNSAIKNMDRANRQKEKAEEKARQASERAGIRKQADAFDNVLGVMDNVVSKAQAEAQAADNRSKLLSKTKVEDNSVVADALSRVNGDAPKKSVGDRLASL